MRLMVQRMIRRLIERNARQRTGSQRGGNQDDLMRLLEENEPRQRGLSRQQINSIRSVRISNANIEEFVDQTCTICLNDCKTRDKVKMHNWVASKERGMSELQILSHSHRNQ
ncbi:UNKNOWN [Stylonychia lemnae]|uniref:Uncharacterized protein n=1 Tax=Stylonychia lemnae TaxID=5949 RepID=A0A078B119_STYLE|nr:UNKNOWN [Stylonychia lemnae]|eukprot:CDW88254.1 UNKNOWN [Stylonychia lemnae]